MKAKKLFALALASICLVACNKNKQEEEGPKYERENESTVYDRGFGDYTSKANAAKAELDDDLRLVKYAEAEAELLGKAMFMPYSTQGGQYAITRVAPRTIPYAKWGNDEDRLKGMIFIKGADTYIKASERAEMLEQWEAARGDATKVYDPAAYLTGKGYTLATDYTTSFTTEPATLDIVNTSEQSDTEILVNMIDGLVEYDNLGTLRGNIATEWSQEPKKVQTATGEEVDGSVWTFKLRDDAKWVKSDGTVYGAVKADDFVAGFQHMLDAAAGLEFLVDGIVVGAHEYLEGTVTDFSKVGIKAVDDKTLTFTLEKVESYFPTRLSYSCFMPLNREFFLSQGGAFGIEQFKDASASANYKYGQYTDIASMVYNGAYIPAAQFDKTNIKLQKNTNYFKPETVKVNSLAWVYDNGENPKGTYDAFKAGTFAGVGLSESSGTLKWAKDDGIFNDYHYVTDTTTTSYLLGVNVNRGTFVLENGGCATTQTEQEKINTHTALQNINFRRAIFRAWDRVTWNAVTRGADMAATNLRNCYTDPNFLSLGKEVTYGGHTFAKGSSYGTLIQYFGDKAGLDVDFADGQDGWFNAAKAKEDMAKAVADPALAPIFANGGKVKLDVVYYSGNTSQVQQAQSFKQTIEAVIGDQVNICLVEATTSDDYYASGYRAATGKAGNFDLFYGSGWGPDYGDPSTYLDTFAGDGAGYMTKILGLF